MCYYLTELLPKEHKVFSRFTLGRFNFLSFSSGSLFRSCLPLNDGDMLGRDFGVELGNYIANLLTLCFHNGKRSISNAVPLLDIHVLRASTSTEAGICHFDFPPSLRLFPVPQLISSSRRMSYLPSLSIGWSVATSIRERGHSPKTKGPDCM